jgi:hypothetical protein
MRDMGWIGPIIGAFLALSGVLVTQVMVARSRHQERQWRLQDEMRLRLIDRGEELYTLIHKWKISFSSNVLHYSIVMRGEIDYNSALDAVNAAGKDNMSSFERIDLIIKVYFPELMNTWAIARES